MVELYPVKYGVSIAKPIFSDGVIIVSGYWHGTRAFNRRVTVEKPPCFVR